MSGSRDRAISDYLYGHVSAMTDDELRRLVQATSAGNDWNLAARVVLAFRTSSS